MAFLISLIRAALGTLLLAAVAINFANVIGRYFFRQPIAWAEEAMVFIQIWCVLIGAILVTYAGSHLRMDAVAALAPRKLSTTLEAIAAALMAATSALLVWVSVTIVCSMIENDQRSLSMNAPMAIPYLAVPLGFAGVMLMSLRKLTRMLRGKA